MRGILLAGAAGVTGVAGIRRPSLSHPVSHPLMPVFDKPLLYYPLATLMLAGIREVLVISSPDDVTAVRHLLSDGGFLGMRIEHATQDRPDGLPQALVLGAGFVEDQKVALALGDTILHGPGADSSLAAHTDVDGALVLARRVHDPRAYAVVEFDRDRAVLSIEERPRRPRSDFAVAGLHFYDNAVLDIARSLRPGLRGRLGITAVHEVYRRLGRLHVRVLGPETAWIDTGDFTSAQAATEFVRTTEVRHGEKVGCLEEIAWRRGWIDDDALAHRARQLAGSGYGQYLALLAGRRADQPVLELPEQHVRAARGR